MQAREEAVLVLLVVVAGAGLVVLTGVAGWELEDEWIHPPQTPRW